MKLISLQIEDKIAYFKHNTLIWSNQNSVGKTTFVRLLLHSLGYSVPPTKHFKFDKVETRLKFQQDDSIYEFERIKNIIAVIKDNAVLASYSTRDEKNQLLSIAFGITEPLLLENMLAVHYFDQEKGWTLLNRGQAISSNHFNVEQFVEGLSGKKLGEIRSKIQSIDREIASYKKIQTIISVKEELQNSPIEYDTNIVSEYNSQINIINIDLKRTKQSLNNLQQTIDDNDKFVEMIGQFKLQVQNQNGEPIPVTPTSLLNFDINQAALRSRATQLNKQIEKMVSEKQNIQRRLEEMGVFEIENQIQRVSKALVDIDLSSQTITTIIKDLSQQKRSLHSKVKSILNKDSVVQKIYDRIKIYAKILGVRESIDDASAFLFTDDLKSYSGAILHLLVFAFRMALLKELQEQKNQFIPIIVDSPKSGELDDKNLKAMFDLLKQEFSNNQIIIVTAENLTKMYDWGTILKLETRLMDDLEDASSYSKTSVSSVNSQKE